MSEKKTVLIRTYHLVEVEEEELCKEEGILDQLIYELSSDKEVQLEEPLLMKWNGTEVIPLLPEINNCGLCAGCGAWTTDEAKEAPMEGLTKGQLVEGQLLCEECLQELEDDSQQ